MQITKISVILNNKHAWGGAGFTYEMLRCLFASWSVAVCTLLYKQLK